MKKSNRTISTCMALTGREQSAAIMLSEIVAFIPHTKDWHGEHQAITQTDEDLAERTGLSIYQARRAKRFLSKNGFICTAVKKSKYHKGNTATVIWLPEQVAVLMEKMRAGHVQIRSTGTEQNRIGHTVQGCTLALYTEEKGKGKATPPIVKEQNFKEHDEKQLAQIKEMFGNG